jgi:anti-sigma regulatory factor (Ser/Thr protein kinase)
MAIRDPHRILLPASPEHLDTVNRFLSDETPEDFRGKLMKIQTAVEELLMNIFRYAHAPDVSGQAEIGCRVAHLDGERYFCVLLRDWGRPYDPFAQAPRPDLQASLAERPIGGLGLHIVKKVSAHYCYSRCTDTNEVMLFFAPEKAHAPPP